MSNYLYFYNIMFFVIFEQLLLQKTYPMKKTITIIVLSFVCFSALFSQSTFDVVDNIKWEVLDGPTGFATGFAKSGNRLFAEPHFYSDDMGESWHKLPDFFYPFSIVATDDVVLINKAVVEEYFIDGVIAFAEFYLSNDSGNNFVKRIETYVGGTSRGRTFISSTEAKNDKTFCFSSYHNRIFNGQLFFTNDGGENWDTISMSIDGQIFTAQDTVVVFGNRQSINDPLDKIPVYVFGNDDFSNPRIDSVSFDLVGSREKALYVDGLYYVAQDDTLVVYSPKTESLVDYSFTSLPIGQFEFINGNFYFSNDRGVFSFSHQDPTVIDTLYISPNSGNGDIPFGIFDDIWLIYDDGDIQRSLDKGLLWERKGRGITNSSGTMQLIDDRFCLDGIYSSPEVDFWSSDNPPTGTPQGDGNVNGQIFTYGDTLVKFEGKTRLESLDNGITWDSLNFPDFHFGTLGFGRIYENRDTFVAYHSNGFSSSDDKGKTRSRHPHYIRDFWWIGNHRDETIIHGMFNGLLILYTTSGVFMSRDYGANWSKITNFPFGSIISNTATITPVLVDGAKRYFYKDNYLYAFQDHYGLWRTPLDELENALRGIVDASDLELTMTTKDLEPKNWTNFTVEVNIENTGTLPNDDIIVHVPKPDEVVFQGRNEYQSTQGHFEFWQVQEWEVGSLEPGESATLTLNYFRKNEKPFDCFAQVISAAEPDLDSSPDNGSCCTISEDDEAVLEFGEAPPNIWGRSSNAQNFGEQSFTTINFNEIESKEISTIAFPNPFNNELNFKIKSESQADGQIQIYDVLGRLILEKPIQLIVGENLETIETTNLPTGILTAKISNSKSEFQRVQVLKQ